MRHHQTDIIVAQKRFLPIFLYKTHIKIPNWNVWQTENAVINSRLITTLTECSCIKTSHMHPNFDAFLCGLYMQLCIYFHFIIILKRKMFYSCTRCCVIGGKGVNIYHLTLWSNYKGVSYFGVIDNLCDLNFI